MNTSEKMEDICTYLLQLVETYSEYQSNTAQLFDDMNHLSNIEIEHIYEEYRSKDSTFQPVNLLRAECARYIQKERNITPAIVELIKQNIREKKISAFGHYSDTYLQQIQSYPPRKRDMFASWKNPWSVFYPFFYRSSVKDKTQEYLRILCTQLIIDLELKKYDCHFVDFQGSNNFGASGVWLALYPMEKQNHKNAFQFFVGLSEKPNAGMVGGRNISTEKEDCREFIHSYNDILVCLKKYKEEINRRNERSVKPPKVRKYQYALDPDKPFIDDKEFQRYVHLLKRKKNIILQGPPGVGKTFIARKLCYEILEEANDNCISMVQFHQSYSYEDFIQGLRPGKNGFERKDGIFYSFCQRAHTNPDKDFFFIIDEINRGNLSKIFGELLMLLESDKRKKKFALNLTYSKDEEDTFFIPSNVHLIGTMNTADRSLAIVDYALRRRFAFISLEPNFGPKFSSYLSQLGIPSKLSAHIAKSISSVNKKITSDQNLGPGFAIGHSYFCSFGSSEGPNNWYREVLEYEIRPLLEEIFFDSLGTVESMLSQLRWSEE